jgi:hypothetical protein
MTIESGYDNPTDNSTDNFNERLFEMPPATTIAETEPTERPHNLVAFGRFLKTEIYDIFGEHDLESLTDAERAWITPDRLDSILILDRDRPRRKKEEELCVVDDTSLIPHEYNLLARSPRSMGAAAYASVLKDEDLDDERQAAAERSIGHTLSGKLEPMQYHLLGLMERSNDLSRLHKEAAQPGYAHQTELTMKSWLGEAWQEFTTMLDAVRVQRNWDDEQRKRADAAMINYLTKGSQRDRTAHWQSMLALARTYLDRRVQLFQNRIIAVEDLLANTAETGDDQSD